MIITNIKDIEKYKGINSLLNYVIDLILNDKLLELNEQKLTIGKNKEIQIFKEKYLGQDFNTLSFKSFHDSITIHYIIEGKETIGILANQEIKDNLQYNYVPEEGCNYYGNEVGEVKYILLSKGDIAIFLEDEVHVTNIKYDSWYINKLNIKVNTK